MHIPDYIAFGILFILMTWAVTAHLHHGWLAIWSQADEIYRQRVLFTLLLILTARLRAGMMASRLNRRGHVTPALTDHLVDEAGW